MKDAISSPVEIPGSVAHYQDVLKYARSEVEYAIGIGLYMFPSDMQLHIGQIKEYNNKIVIVTAGMQLGSNTHVNNPMSPAVATAATPQGVDLRTPRPPPHVPQPTTSIEEKLMTDQHEGEKTALVVGVVAIRIIALWFFR